MKRRIITYLYLAVLMCEAFAEENKQISILKNDVSRNDFVHLLSSLIKVNQQRLNDIAKTNKLQDYGTIAKNKSDSVSSSISFEDSLSTYDKTVPPISERQEEPKKDLYNFFDDLRTNDPNIDPEIFRDDLNSHIEAINQQKSQLNFKRDGFHNTPKLNKKTVHPRNKHKHPGVTRTVHSLLLKTKSSEDNNDLSVINKVNTLIPRKSHSLLPENVPQKKTLNDLEPKIRKSKQRKHKPIEPLSDVSDDFSMSNAKFLSNLKTSKNVKENEKAEKSNKLANDHKNKLPQLNKRRKPRNRNDSENRHEKRKYSGISIEGKEYIEARHIQPKLDIALNRAKEVLKEKPHKTHNGLRSILRSITTDFVKSKAELPAEVPIVNNVNDNTKPHKDEFTLTILDNNENQGQPKTGDISSHLGSSLLDMDASMYQHILRQESHEPNKVSSASKGFQNKKADNLKSLLTSSLITKQQSVKIGRNDKAKKEPYDHLSEKVESDQNLKEFAFGVNSYVDIESILTDKPKLDTIKPENTVLRQGVYKNDAKPYTKYKPTTVKTIQPKIGKKNFDGQLTMDDKEEKITNLEDKVDLNDDFSKAEILLTDSNESDENSGDAFIKVNNRSDHEDSESEPIKRFKEVKGIGSVLRNSRRGIRSKKSFRKCHRACIAAYTSVCRRIKCSPKAKRDLKYQCRKSCKRTFGKRKYSSSEK